MRNKNIILLISVLLVLAIVSSACSKPSPEASNSKPIDGTSIDVSKKDKDTLIFGAENEPGGLDITTQTTMGSMTVAKPCFETLINRNEKTGEFEPCLATDWEWKDDRTLFMTLRDDVFFHNGEKMNSEDIKYTITRLSKGSATANLYADFDGENSIIIDDTHIEIKFNSVCAPAISLLCSPSANVVNKKYVEDVGDEVFSRKPIGTGPFQFVEWVAGNRIVYERFEKYWREKPSYKNLVFKIIVDATARVLALESGSVDLTVAILPSFSEKLLSEGVPGINFYQIPSAYIYWLAMAEDFEPFKDARVRKAIGHAIDMEQVCKASWGVNCQPMDSIYPPSAWGYSKRELFNYDPALSKKLLSEAGYPNGFEVTFVVSEATNPSNAAEAIQAMLSQVGVKVSLQKYTASIWQSMVLDGSTSFSFGGLTISARDASQVVSHLHSKSPQITYKRNDPKIDEFIKNGLSEQNLGERTKIYDELQDYVIEMAYDVPVLIPYLTIGSRDYVKGIEPHSMMLLDFVGIHF